jgi:1-phosphofructokinase
MMTKPAVLTVTLNPSLDKTIVLDHLTIGSLHRAKQVRLDPGGKGINVAKLLKSFGVQVLASGLSGGPEGEQLLNYLESAGIETNFQRIAGKTRTNLKLVDVSRQVTTEINELGAEVTEAERSAYHNLLTASMQDVKYMVLGGSLPPGVPVGIYQEIISIANSRGIQTVLDADGEALIQGLTAIPTAIKPNIHELEQMLGRKLLTDDHILSAAKEIIDTGVSLVIVSMGEKGSLVVSKDESYRALPFPIVVKSTVGAGDSMVAGIIYAWIQQMSIKETAAWTTASGTLTASKEGTQMCSMDEVSAHINQVQLEQI